MSVAENKKLALSFLDAVARADIDTLDALMTEDATWWMASSTRKSGLATKEEFLSLVSLLHTMADGHQSFEVDELTAEEDRLSLTARGHLLLADGRTYKNHYHFLLWARDGRISAGKEYYDSYHTYEVFGTPG